MHRRFTDGGRIDTRDRGPYVPPVTPHPSEPEPFILDQRRYVLDGADFPICGAELLDAYDHDRALTLLLVTLQPGQRGIYSTEDDLVVERVW